MRLTLQRNGLFKSLWRLLPKPSDRYVVGEDLEGNKYYEHPPTTDYKHRPKRSVKYLKKIEWDEVGKNMPAQWQAWLRHTRQIPPTIDELKADLARIERTQRNAAILEAHYAQQRLGLNAPNEQQQSISNEDEDKHHEEELIKARKHFSTNPLEAFEPPSSAEQSGHTINETKEIEEERKHGFNQSEMQLRQEEEQRQLNESKSYAPGTGQHQEWKPTLVRRK